MPTALMGTGRRHYPSTTDPGTAQPLPPPRRRRFKKQPTSSSTWKSGCRGTSGGRRSGPTTPLLRWKFADEEAPPAAAPDSEKKKNKKSKKKKKNVPSASTSTSTTSTSTSVARRGRASTASPSARQLAAGIWQLQQQQQVHQVLPPSLDREPSSRGHLQAPHLCNWKVADPLDKDPNSGYSSSTSASRSRNGTLSKHRRCEATLPNLAMERATKWDPGMSKASDEVLRFYGHLKLMEDQQLSSASLIPTLKKELEEARLRINLLEDERSASKMKLEHFLRRLADEKSAWRSREHEKVRATIDEMRRHLNEEKKHRRRLEVMNAKLVGEIKEIRLVAKQYLQDYEEEKKTREIMEEVCTELAKEIEEDKAEVEVLRMESLKIREEVEEERKMMQMAEVWREERVQMKLIDAKLSLEEKYTHMSRLESDIESFLTTHMSNPIGESTAVEAELLKKSIRSINIQDIEFAYNPPTASEDIFAVFEELQQMGEAQEKGMIGHYHGQNSNVASKIRTVSPNLHTLDGTHAMIDSSGVNCEDESGWETISPEDELGSDSSEPFPNGTCLEHNASTNTEDWMEDVDNANAYSSMDTYSESGKQSSKKGSSIARFWQASCPADGESCKMVSIDLSKYNNLQSRRFSNTTAMSPEKISGDVCSSPVDVEHCSSPGSTKGHLTLGRKGCIEWPKGAPKHSLKGKLFKARIDGQKVQLRQVLKQKF